MSSAEVTPLGVKVQCHATLQVYIGQNKKEARSLY